MKSFHYTDIQLEDVNVEGQGQVGMRWLITKETGAEHFAMRMFEVAPKTQIAPHSHSWEHEVYILEGNGIFSNGEEDLTVGPGSVVFIPGDEPHQLYNCGDKPMRYLCLIPYSQE